jgi:hypothetical protein
MSSDALNPDNKRFLEHLPQSERSTVSNMFLDPIRSGMRGLEAIVANVAQQVEHKSSRPYADTERQKQCARWLSLLDFEKEDALALAAYYVAYNDLPPSEREKLKNGSAVAFVKESMAGKPVTEKQKELLGKLGFTGTFPADRKAASDTIDNLLKGGAAH